MNKHSRWQHSPGLRSSLMNPLLVVLLSVWASVSVTAAELIAEVSALTLDVADPHVQNPTIQLLHKVERGADGQAALQVYAVATDAKDTRKRSLWSFALQAGEWRRNWQQPLDANVQLLQLVAGPKKQSPPRLLGYAVDSVVELNEAKRLFQPLQTLGAIYRSSASELEAEVDFAQDLTDDGRVDVLVPDFAGWRFSQQRADGSFTEPQLFGPVPIMGMGSARYVYFTAHQPYVFDHNQDGLLDIGFWQDDALLVHHQSADAVFATEAVRFVPGMDIEFDGFFSLSVGTEADNPEGRQAVLDTIEDLNGDGLPDLLIYSVTGEGLFGKETSYEIHLGKTGVDGSLVFEQQPSSVVGSGGIQINVERQDLDGDGQLEMLVTSFDLGLRSIIRGLISRTANLDLSIYRLENGRYPKKPNVTRRVTAKLDLANGDIFIPGVLAGDVDGDGLKDLLVPSGKRALKVFAGTGTAALFEKSAQTIALDLPQGGGGIEVIDIDADGDDDLLLHFAGDKNAGNKDETRAPRVVAVSFSRK